MSGGRKRADFIERVTGFLSTRDKDIFSALMQKLEASGKKTAFEEAVSDLLPMDPGSFGKSVPDRVFDLLLRDGETYKSQIVSAIANAVFGEEGAEVKAETNPETPPDARVKPADSHTVRWRREKGCIIFPMTAPNLSSSGIEAEDWIKVKTSAPPMNHGRDAITAWLKGKPWSQHVLTFSFGGDIEGITQLHAEMMSDPGGVLDALSLPPCPSKDMAALAENWITQVKTRDEGAPDKVLAVLEAAAFGLQNYLHPLQKTLIERHGIELAIDETIIGPMAKTLAIAHAIRSQPRPAPEESGPQDPRGNFLSDRNITDEDILRRVLFRASILGEDLCTAAEETLLDMKFSLLLRAEGHHARIVNFDAVATVNILAPDKDFIDVRRAYDPSPSP